MKKYSDLTTSGHTEHVLPQIYQEIQSLLGADWTVSPSSEIKGNVRRVVVQNLSSGQVLPVDLQVHKGATPFGPTLSLGPQISKTGAPPPDQNPFGDFSGQKYRAVFSPQVTGQYTGDLERYDPSKTQFRGVTSEQQFAGMIINAMAGVNEGNYDTLAESFGAMTAGAGAYSPITRVPTNMVETAQQKQFAKVRFAATGPGGAELPPHIAEAVQQQYIQNVQRGTGRISSSPVEQMTWTQLASGPYYPSKDPGWLVPEANIVHRQYTGLPGQQVAYQGYAELSMGLKGYGKGSVEYGGLIAQPYIRTIGPSGAEVYTPQTPGRIREGESPSYASLNMLYPGEKKVQNTELANVLFTPTPYSGGGYVFESPVSNRPDIYGTQSTITQALPTGNLLDLLSGNTTFKPKDLRGERFSEGEMNISLGTLTTGGVEYDFSHRKGVAAFHPGAETGVLEIPSYWDPTTGLGAASEKYGQSTEMLASQLQEKLGIEVRRGTTDQIRYVLEGTAQTGAKWRGHGGKMGGIFTGQELSINAAGTQVPIEYMTGEAKGPGIAFSTLASRNIEQMSGIMQQWASNVGTPEAQQMYKYFQGRFGSGDRPINLEHMARKYRSITRGLGDQRFTGSATALSNQIFESVFLNASDEQNQFNLKVFGAGYVEAQQMNVGAIHPEQYELMKRNALEAGVSPEEFSKHYQLGGVSGGSLQDLLVTPKARPFLVKGMSTPQVPEYVGGSPDLNLEAQLALAQNYPSFPRGQATPLQLAKQNILAFTSFGKQALTGQTMIPEGAETLSEDQMLQMKDMLARKDLGNKEFLEGMKGIVKDPSALLRTPKTGAVLPSLNAIETLGYEKYGEEIGPILGKNKRAWEKLLREELQQGPTADPVSAGNRAISGLYKHFNRIIERRSDFAKGAFSVGAGVGATGRYQGNPALPLGTISYGQEMEDFILRNAGVSQRDIKRNRAVFDEPLKVLGLRYPQESLRDFAGMQYMGAGGISSLIGEQRSKAIQTNPRAYGTAMVDPSFAQYATGDWDFDPMMSIFGLQKSGKNVVPMSSEQVQEISRLTQQELDVKERTTFPDVSQRSTAGAAVGAMQDFFSGLDPVRKAVSKLENVPLSDIGERALEVSKAKTIGMGAGYGVLRSGISGAALNPESNLLASAAGAPASYQVALDMMKMGGESAGTRLPAAIAKINAGLDKEGRAFLGYSTNVKSGDYPEYNRFYPSEANSGSLEEFLGTYVSHATAPIQERGGQKIYAQGAEYLASQFALPQHREELQATLEGTSPEKYGVEISKYHRGLLSPEEAKSVSGMTQYRQRLLDIPAMQTFLSRATSKSYAEGERGVNARFALQSLGEFAGPERVAQWEAGAVAHDFMYRMPQGPIAAGRVSSSFAQIRNPVLRQAYAGMMAALHINPQQEQIIRQQESIAAPVDTQETAMNLDNLNQLYDSGAISRTRYNEIIQQREEQIASGAIESTQVTKSKEKSEVDNLLITGAGRRGLTNDPSNLSPMELVRWRASAMQGLTDEERSKVSNFAETQTSGGGGGDNQPPAPPAPPATSEPSDDDKKKPPMWEKPKSWSQRRAAGEEAAIKARVEAQMNVANSVKQQLASGNVQTSGSGFPRVGKYKQQTYVNQGYLAMRTLGPGAEDLAESLRSDFGVDISDPGSFAQSFGGILDDPTRVRAVMGKYGPTLKQYARGGEAISKAQAFIGTSGYGAVGDYQDTLSAKRYGDPNMVKSLGVFGGALDQKLLGAGKPGEVTINIPTEKISELNRLYKEQERIVGDLNTAKGKEKRDLEKEQEDVNTKIRKAQGGIYLEGLRQEVGGYRQLLESGQAPAGTVKKLMAAEKQMQGLQAEQQAEEEEGQVGPFGRAARKLLGGFGLMYLRSVTGFATQGLGYGMQERNAWDQQMAQGMYSATGVGRIPYNQQQALQNQMALQGTNISPLVGLQQFGAANPALRDVGSMATAGIGAWAYSQWAASTMPGTAAGSFLTKASPWIGIAAAGIATAADVGARTQDVNLGARIGRANVPGINDLFAAGVQRVTDRDAYQNTREQSYLAGGVRKAFEAGSTYEDITRTGYIQKGGGTYLPEETDVYYQVARELQAQNLNWNPETASQVAGYLRRSPQTAMNSEVVQAIGRDYQFGGWASQTSQSLMMATGGGVASAYSQQQTSLQAQLAMRPYDEAQKAAMQAGIGMMGQMPDVLTMPGVGAYGGGQDLNMGLRLAEHLGSISGTPAQQAVLSASQAYTRAQFAGLNPQRPQYFQMTNAMTPEEAFQSQMQSQALQGQADYRINMAQGFRQQAYQFGNQQLGNQLYNQFLQVPQGQEWQYAQMLNANPMRMQTEAQNGLALSQMPGLGTIGGQTIGAEYTAMADVGLSGNLTGLKWGSTSFQLGDISGSQMSSRLFGNNWATNNKFSQGLIQAGISGASLGGAITLPTGEQISSVGGTMGMQLYQQQEQYQYQMSQLGLQQRQTDLTQGYQEKNWDIEDQLRSLSKRQQEWSFGQQERQLALNRSQFQENFALNQQQSQMQRAWTRQDWGFNAENRSMQWGWKQEDFSEGLRFMTGRDRRLAERQMGRETIMHDREGEQIDRQKKRQEELWNLEDERFKLQLEHFEQSAQMQEEALKKSRQFYEERMKLQDEQIKAQREYQQEQMKIQREQIQLTQEHARKNLEFQQTMAQLQLAMELTNAAANTLADDGLQNFQQAIADTFNPGTVSVANVTGANKGSYIPPQIRQMNLSNNASSPTVTLPPGNDIGLHPGGGGRASGGPLSLGGVDLVGEQGEELIINGVVVPNEITQQLKKLGVQPGSSGMEGIKKMDDILGQYSSQYINQTEGSSGNILDKFGSSFVPMKTTQPESKPMVVSVFIGNEELKRFVVDAVGEQI